MATSIITPVGPLFGPDFVVVTANDETGREYSLHVYPDAMNHELREAGLPQHYYFQPSRVYLARKETSPDDFDFGMTIFKGLMTDESTLGIDPGQTDGGSAEVGGGFCAFSTTFAIPDSVIEDARRKIRDQQHTPPPGRLAQLFGRRAGGPEPLLGIVPITHSDVSIAVPDLVQAGTEKVPMMITAAGTGKGSIEAHGYNSFLVTCNQFAAGAIAGALQEGKSPFTVYDELKESFYVNAVTIKVTVDVAKMYDSFSAALSTGGFLGISSLAASYAYERCRTTGGITTEITQNSAALTPELEAWVTQNVDEMRKTAMELVKTEIFDWQPTPDAPATADRGWFGSLFGGSAVSLKGKQARREVKLTQELKLNRTITVTHRVSGTLNDLEPAVRADLDKYLSVIDIGQWFSKLQVAGTCAVNFGEKLPDGTDLRDPIRSVQMQVSYPDYSDPVRADGSVNLVTRAEGFHYTAGQQDRAAPAALALWSEVNPDDIVNVAFLRLDREVPEWPADQVRVRKTLVYDAADPRVDLDGGRSQVVVERTGTDHAPILDPAEVGYVFVHFVLDRQLPKDNVTVTLTVSIGDRTDVIEVDRARQKNVVWELFSDKYFDADEMTCTVEVTVAGPSFTDDPVVWTGEPETFPVPVGRLKYLNPFKLSLPPAPAEEVARINAYIAGYPTT
ncbi:hypothetical protein [Vallicoccus soli]|uniref:Uncharacterized protein n=1 Tax=Vallicoccus soli TaxID=2339232 RepID=A0A3A3Z1I5_9ACTN|nr:hypothetical protein [Vallicoccus soli]RJK96377.1 hypothetical protein D5H78_09080 [Vallicoccus soli]